MSTAGRSLKVQGTFMLTVRSRRAVLAAVAAAGLVGTVAMPTAAQAADAKRHKTVNLQLLAINDFHGNLEPPAGSSGTIREIDPATGQPVSTPAAWHRVPRHRAAPGPDPGGRLDHRRRR